jgi:hypothetical protein
MPPAIRIRVKIVFNFIVTNTVLFIYLCTNIDIVCMKKLGSLSKLCAANSKRVGNNYKK